MPGLVATVDVERAIEEALDAGREPSNGFSFRHAANRVAERADAWGHLVPVRELEQRDRGEHEQGQCAEADDEGFC